MITSLLRMRLETSTRETGQLYTVPLPILTATFHQISENQNVEYNPIPVPVRKSSFSRFTCFQNTFSYSISSGT